MRFRVESTSGGTEGGAEDEVTVVGGSDEGMEGMGTLDVAWFASYADDAAPFFRTSTSS